MHILQFRFIDTTDQERALISNFCDFLNTNIINIIDTKKMRKKLEIRLKYIYDCNWIIWYNYKLCNVNSVMKAINESLTYKSENFNIWKLNINRNILIPGSYTSIDKLIRFLNFGDLNYTGIGFLNTIINKFNKHYLNSLWRLYIINKLGIYTKSKIEID